MSVLAVRLVVLRLRFLNGSLVSLSDEASELQSCIVDLE
jgi:hypothetical protein